VSGSLVVFFVEVACLAAEISTTLPASIFKLKFFKIDLGKASIKAPAAKPQPQ
jgi:hypothetical protein